MDGFFRQSASTHARNPSASAGNVDASASTCMYDIQSSQISVDGVAQAAEDACESKSGLAMEGELLFDTSIHPIREAMLASAGMPCDFDLTQLHTRTRTWRSCRYCVEHTVDSITLERDGHESNAPDEHVDIHRDEERACNGDDDTRTGVCSCVVVSGKDYLMHSLTMRSCEQLFQRTFDEFVRSVCAPKLAALCAFECDEIYYQVSSFLLLLIPT